MRDLAKGGSHLVTVAIPVYNRADLLAQALNSLSRQTLDDFFVIVCDDASTEDLAPLGAQYDNLHIAYHRFDDNVGAHLNHQRALHLCRSRYVVFLNSDDLLLPQALEFMRNELERNLSAAACVGGRVEFRDGPGGILDPVKVVLPAPIKVQVKGGWLPLETFCCFAPSQTMYRLDSLLRIGGFNPGCRTAYDWEVFLSLQGRDSIAVVNDLVAGYRLHDAQLMRRNEIDGGALNARDALFILSAANPLRERLNMPWLQQQYLRQAQGWTLMRRAIQIEKSFKSVIIVVGFLAEYRLLLPMLLLFPVWIVVFVVRKLMFKKGRTAAPISPEIFIEALMTAAAPNNSHLGL